MVGRLCRPNDQKQDAVKRDSGRYGTSSTAWQAIGHARSPALGPRGGNGTWPCAADPLSDAQRTQAYVAAIFVSHMLVADTLARLARARVQPSWEPEARGAKAQGRYAAWSRLLDRDRHSTTPKPNGTQNSIHASLKVSDRVRARRTSGPADSAASRIWRPRRRKRQSPCVHLRQDRAHGVSAVPPTMERFVEGWWSNG